MARFFHKYSIYLLIFLGGYVIGKYDGWVEWAAIIPPFIGYMMLDRVFDKQ